MNHQLEEYRERIIAGSFGEVMELMARVCRDTGYVLHKLLVEETTDIPFDYSTKVKGK